MTTTIPADLAIIRPAVSQDYAAIATLLTSNNLPTEGVEDGLADFLVAEAQGTIVGVVGMEYRDDYGLLRSTAVDAAWRSKRIARRLINRIIADAEARGITACYLLTTTAERYFPAFGFSITSRGDIPDSILQTAEFCGTCPASATAMSLALHPRPEPAAGA